VLYVIDIVSLHVNLLTSHFYCLAPDVIISPESGSLVARRGARATLSCVYRPNSDLFVTWGRLINGQPEIIFATNTTDTFFTSRSLIFDPVSTLHTGRYYCFVPLNPDPSMDQYSSIVDLIVFGKCNILANNTKLL